MGCTRSSKIRPFTRRMAWATTPLHCAGGTLQVLAAEDAEEVAGDAAPWCTRGHTVRPENGAELCSLGLRGDLASPASPEFRDCTAADVASPRSDAPEQASPVALQPAVAWSVSPVPSTSAYSSASASDALATPRDGGERVEGCEIRAGPGFQFVRRSDGRLIISAIRPGGPADVEGSLQAGDEILAVDGMDMAEACVRQVRSVLLGMQGSRVRLKVFRASEQHTFQVELQRGGTAVHKQSLGDKLKSLQTRVDEQESIIDLLRLQLSSAQAREARLLEMLSLGTRDASFRVCSSASKPGAHNTVRSSDTSWSPIHAQPAPSNTAGSFSSLLEWLNPAHLLQKEATRPRTPTLKPQVEVVVPPTPPRPSGRSALIANELHGCESAALREAESAALHEGIGNQEPADQTHSRQVLSASDIELLFQETGTQTSPGKGSPRVPNPGIPQVSLSGAVRSQRLKTLCFCMRLLK